MGGVRGEVQRPPSSRSLSLSSPPPHLVPQILADGTSVKRHPSVSSVFYLNDIGGGTVVFGQTRDLRSLHGALAPALPSHVAVAFPTRNQLLVFQGDRLHAGAPPSRLSRETSGAGGLWRFPRATSCWCSRATACMQVRLPAVSPVRRVELVGCGVSHAQPAAGVPGRPPACRCASQPSLP
jgi:hypothetical protein